MLIWRPSVTVPQAAPSGRRRLASEQAAALLHGAGVQRQAVFQREDGLQAAAQVFGAAETDRATGRSWSATASW
jgi:hypothetical protein